MIKLKVVDINEFTGKIFAEDDSGKSHEVSLFGLQEGANSPNLLSSVKMGASIYVPSDSTDRKLIKHFYLKPPSEEVAHAVELLKKKFAKKRDYPLVGDIVIGESGKNERVTIIDGDLIQFHSGSNFNFGRPDKFGDVHVQQSGSCGFQEKISDLVDTGNYETADFWCFKDFDARAHNSVRHEVKVKVWKFKKK